MRIFQLLLLMLIATSTFSQEYEIGILGNVGISQFHKDVYHIGVNFVGYKLTSRESTGFNTGIYYRKMFKSGIFGKVELSYNRLREYQSAQDKPIIEREIISIHPFEEIRTRIGEVIYTEEKRTYEAINFPIYIGYRYKRWFVELGFGGTLIWSKRDALYTEALIRGKFEVYNQQSNRQGYSFVQKLFRSNIGYELSNRFKIKIDAARAYENDKFGLYYSYYMFGLECALLRKNIAVLE